MYFGYDYQPDLNDWKPFGGWTKPNFKQYDSGSVCDMSVRKYLKV